MSSLLLLLWLACSDPKPEPLRYSVVRGDTLAAIAKRHAVTVQELKDWNGLDGDRIEVGQILLIRTEAAPEAAPKKTPKGSRPKKVGPTPGSVSLPTPKPCVPFAPELGDEGMAAPAGLDRAEVKRGLDAVLPRAQGCPFFEGGGKARVVFELVIGCDGLVRSVEVADPDGASEAGVQCAMDVIRGAEFPAHDMADGMPVTYPLSIEIP